MKLEEFDYALPLELIAQQPATERDSSRLMVLDRSLKSISHHSFQHLPTLLKSGDLLVLNDTRVMQARLIGVKSQTRGRAELLILQPRKNVATVEALGLPIEATEWLCLGQASKGFRGGTRIAFPGVEAEIVEVLGNGRYGVTFRGTGGETMGKVLDRIGQLPLPAYIERSESERDQERYQTVYANEPGSVAAPTAGLHFTSELLGILTRQGIATSMVRLDVGPGTFQPVREAEIERHQMHQERYFVPEKTAQAVTEAKQKGRRVVAVGTTVIRTLEAAWDSELSVLKPGGGDTTLFIFPSYRFRVADALITNFHLPRSSLLMLVSAFAGTDFVREAYRDAISLRYRFFSYGDAMFIQ